ncbi:MAG: hypothetical protein HC842_00425 [Cytophagales bacterium]|nr:hypothetical protein [Cytophagales bacterium]
MILELLKELGAAVRQKVHSSLRTQSLEQMAAVYHEGVDDTIYHIDKEVEDLLVPLLEARAAALGGVVLLAEGINDSRPLVLPPYMREEEAAWRLLIDPIDGTRGIMYDKRSVFLLAGAAPNQGANTRLQDITVALMAELPTSRALYADMLWATKGQGTQGERFNLWTQERSTFSPQPSRAASLLQGFGQVARFFPPGRERLAAIEEEMLALIFPDMPEGKALVFEDQYISSGGQLYELLMGHDRYVADVRHALFTQMRLEGLRGGHVCHPYDLAAHLIGAEAGLIITDVQGASLDAPFSLTAPVDWIAYANRHIHQQVQPAFELTLRKHQLIA